MFLSDLVLAVSVLSDLGLSLALSDLFCANSVLGVGLRAGCSRASVFFTVAATVAAATAAVAAVATEGDLASDAAVSSVGGAWVTSILLAATITAEAGAPTGDKISTVWALGGAAGATGSLEGLKVMATPTTTATTAVLTTAKVAKRSFLGVRKLLFFDSGWLMAVYIYGLVVGV